MDLVTSADVDRRRQPHQGLRAAHPAGAGDPAGPAAVAQAGEPPGDRRVQGARRGERAGPAAALGAGARRRRVLQRQPRAGRRVRGARGGRAGDDRDRRDRARAEAGRHQGVGRRGDHGAAVGAAAGRRGTGRPSAVRRWCRRSTTRTSSPVRARSAWRSWPTCRTRTWCWCRSAAVGWRPGSVSRSRRCDRKPPCTAWNRRWPVTRRPAWPRVTWCTGRPTSG